MSNAGKIQIDYDLFVAMRNICLDVAEQAEIVNDIDEDGDYRIEPYGGGIIFIRQDDMEHLRKLKEIY